MTNRLATETSPYLLQHANNPVDWYPWGSEALERARAEDKPIFLSIGYSACHWCHVMAHESFENPAIADQLNRDFVPIKVDREERPDLDDVYMAAVQTLTGSGGWPMSVFLTPTLEPFFGGTYFPPNDRHGMPGFPRVLSAVTEAYRDRREEVVEQGRQLGAHLREQLEVQPGRTDVERRQLDAAAVSLGALFDARHGGFGGAPKFPAPMTLEFLLRAWRRSRDANVLQMVTFTLDQMANGGIHDQVGGGFARYSTDAHWLVPHFEKMLYDNAQLAHAYLEAYRATSADRYAEVARRTLDFMMRELQTPDGGFASALDADSEGEEGRFYTWDRGSFLDTLRAGGLGSGEADAAAAYWGVVEGGNWDGHSILNVASAEAPPADLLDQARTVLLTARGQRVRPGRDDKQLAAWNGMALRALAMGFLVLGDERFAEAARRCVRFIRGHLLRDEGRIWRTARDGKAHTPGFCEDSAHVADGLLAAHAALGNAADLELAAHLMDRAIADFWDEASGTFFDTSHEHDRTVARPRSLTDGATPAANSVAADVLLRLALLTGQPDHDRRARSVLRAAGPALERHPVQFGRMLAAADRALNEPVDAVIAGANEPAAVALRRAAAALYQPDLVIAQISSEDGIAAWPLFEGKAAREGLATAYVCRGYACEEPTQDPERVRAQVAGLP